MVSFKRLTSIFGYLSFFLLFGVAAILFFGFIQRETLPAKKVNFKVEEKAKGVNLWRIAISKKFHIIADNMIKQNQGIVKLINPKLWIYKDKEPPVFIKSKEALIYPNNNVYVTGGIVLRREDLIINADDAYWYNKKSILKSDKPFNGFNSKSKFKGKSFIYFENTGVLDARGVDIWLK